MTPHGAQQRGAPVVGSAQRSGAPSINVLHGPSGSTRGRATQPGRVIGSGGPSAGAPTALCYRAPGTRGGTRRDGELGLFTDAPQKAGTILVVFVGARFPFARFQALPAEVRRRSIQVAATELLVPRPVCDADYLNHSCAPNAGLRGAVTVVALRDIEAGEEICYDYAMSDTLPYDSFSCGCGAATCRGRVSGEDWRSPELQARYAGWFAPHVQAAIRRGQ